MHILFPSPFNYTYINCKIGTRYFHIMQKRHNKILYTIPIDDTIDT